ncbi:MAG: phenylalanine--tRNA ligase subunit alpha [Verrucomicrobia bacterium]|nr:phenylalanine--tRNA ligase subunit alpha [Verrucomicrobiota bacterium]MDE3047437.1 phenylalanine--tRNA ligase subunit alpha [Verrucomicrobiota bacterium]
MASLHDQIGELRSQFMSELRGAVYSKDLENLKTKYLGKKGPIQALMVSLKTCAPEERPYFGKVINDLKEELTLHCDHSLARLKESELDTRLGAEWIDVTLPGRKRHKGRLHPITQAMNRIVDILIGMGFSVQLGPDVDTDYYNFSGLNFAPDHPARDMQDTFYLNTSYLLRTHTSNVQVHTMEGHAPPIRIIAPGRCFRNEDISARSHVFFHQVEGIYIDERVTFADLFSTMDEFLSKLFGEKTATRYRPSYFPFVEPGLEVDVRCISCQGAGCRLCKHTGWLEILGAGMVHPNVLKEGNIDPERYSGYAWGMGIERLTMLLNDIRDIRLFTENDIRFLEQFP